MLGKKHTIHEDFMDRAIELALNGLGKVSPNPLVGCLVVKDGEVIGEGFHREFGSDHAEVDACKNSSKSPSGATIYVTLEPCSIIGKTPPCTDYLISNGIRSVYIGMLDPNPSINGKGVEQLKAAGIDVHINILEDECRELNKGYINWQKYKRPWVIVKVAESYDGYISKDSDTQTNITEDEALAHSHKLRSQVDAILIGRQTALTDNPRLTVRRINGPNPIRIILDTNRTLPLELNIFDNESDTILICSNKKFNNNRMQHCQYLVCDEDDNGKLDVSKILDLLGDIGITSLLIEGGAKVITSFVEQNLVNEVYLYKSQSKIIEGSLKSPIIIDDWDVLDTLNLGVDSLKIARKKELCLQE